MIWLVGHRGMLGSAVRRRLDAAGIEHLDTDLEVDITSRDDVSEFSRGKAIEWVINCAAYTAVDKAEKEESTALAVNATGPENLAVAVRILGARLLHISTDYVFDGDADRSYRESDPTNPRSAYGRTKQEGEARVLRESPDAIIIRTSWLYGHDGPNFVQTMLRLFAERDELGVVDDQRGSPTYADDLAGAVVVALGGPAGIYHFSNDGATSWFGFASEIQRQATALGLSDGACRLEPITTEDYPVPAPRPRNSVFNKDKIQDRLGVHLRPWQDALSEYLSAEADSVNSGVEQ